MCLVFAYERYPNYQMSSLKNETLRHENIFGKKKREKGEITICQRCPFLWECYLQCDIPWKERTVEKQHKIILMGKKVSKKQLLLVPEKRQMMWEAEGVTFSYTFLFIIMSLKVIFHPRVVEVPEISRTGRPSFTSNSKKNFDQLSMLLGN